MDFPEMDRLLALLAVPSVSARPEHAPDMDRAAEMCAQEVRRAGGVAGVRRAAGHPFVVGEVQPSGGRAGAPLVLLYGHYDVQPPGPLDRWTSAPFAPEIRDGSLYARGASDDKGNLFMLLAAVQRLAAEGALPVRVRVLIDGEEESAGTSAVDHILADPEPADVAVIFDAPMAAPGRPSVCLGLRGVAYVRVHVRVGDSDLHSGLYGGPAMNAAHALMAVLGAVLPRDGRVPAALAAGVAPATDAEVATWPGLPPGAAALAAAGGRPADVRAADEFYLRTLAAPSLDVHGIRAGDPSEVKTVIPCTAEATLSLRVAPGQDAEAMIGVLDGMLRAAAPPGACVEVERAHVAHAALIDAGEPMVARAIAAIEASTGWPVAPVRMGGSLPVVAALAERGIPTVLTGFGLPDDQIHAPDERLRVDHLEIGTRAAMAMLRSFGTG